MQSTYNRELNLPHVSSTGRLASVFPQLKSGNFLSLGQILDENKQNCAILTSKEAIIAKDTSIIAKGYRNETTNGMWHIEIPSQFSANTIIHKNQPKQQLTVYLHAACFSPAISTFINAIKCGYLTSWSGLTTDLITKHLPPQIATIKGLLMDQEAQGLQSTQNNTPMHEPHNDEDEWIVATQRTNNVMVDTLQPTDKSYSDLTG